MEIKHPPELNCVGCGRPLLMERMGDPEERGATFDSRCRECKVLYRLLLAPYQHSTQ